MKVLLSDAHLGHQPRGELYDGRLVSPFESSARWDHVVSALDAAGFDDRPAVTAAPPDLLARVHDPAYLTFLSEAWAEWTASGRDGEMIPTCFANRRMSGGEPSEIDGRLGWFAFAAETSITAGTWDAALGAAALAHSAQRLVSGGERAAFALCRPPGHHAAADYFGGYCFLNNAAIAAQGLLDDGADRVAVLDVDFHHGNGTQDIFWRRGDVGFASIHGDPRHEFPYFSGFAHEQGEGPGHGHTHNHPLPPGSSFAAWGEALDAAIAALAAPGIDALVVSLGVDTFEHDPISSFRLGTGDFRTYGATIGRLGVPTVFVLEGGYAVDDIGTNTVNVLTGFEDTA